MNAHNQDLDHRPRTTLAGWSTLFILVTLAGCQTPRAELPELLFEREQLENGLTVIYHQDHRLPLVTVNLWYYVGAKDEVPGRSGFAHLFEHLMFMGTKRVPLGEFDKLIEGAGGSNNATTSHDRTNYFDEGPSGLLPSLLYLEADRMDALGQSIDEEKLETQLRVVQNERRQSYENRPYGRAALERSHLLYPPGHPYHEPVIGSHKDLENATVEDVKAFFDRFYVPANASLVVAGDFDVEEARGLVREYFGKFPSGEPAPRLKPTPVEPQGEKRVTHLDRVQLPVVSFVYYSPPLFQEGDADLDIAASILGQGKSSRLYRSLVYERELAQSVSCTQRSQLLGSTFVIRAAARPGQDLDELEQAMDEELSRFLESPPTSVEMERARNGIEVGFWNEIQDLGARANLLNTYQFYFQDPGGVARDVGRYGSVTSGSVEKWARATLQSGGRLVERVVPGTPEEPGDTPAEATSPPSEELLPPGPPGLLAGKSFDPPVPSISSLDSGVPLWVLPMEGVPLVTLILTVRGAGSASDPAGRSGLASLTASMLDEGAGGRGPLELADDLDLLGATLVPLAAREHASIVLNVLKKNLGPALQLFADVLLRPEFNTGELDRVKTLAVNALRQREVNPAQVARLVADRSFFGDGHPYAAPTSGYISTFSAISADDVHEFYRQRWQPGNASLVAVGDVTPGEIQKLLEKRLGGWKASGDVLPVPPPPALRPGPRPRLIVVEKENAPQTVIRFNLPGRARTDPLYTGLLLGNTIFGRSFTSRLNQNLRETNKYTYGASSDFHRLEGQGAFIIQTSVKTDKTGEALGEIAREMWGMGSGLREGELEKSRATALRRAVESLGTVNGSAATLAVAQQLLLPPDHLLRELERVSAAGQADVEGAVADVIRWEEATIVLVGDREALMEELREADQIIRDSAPEGTAKAAMGLPEPLFLDAEGNPAEER